MIPVNASARSGPPRDSAIAEQMMTDPADLSPTIIEALYCEAMLLADEAREAFDLAGEMETASLDQDLARVALSCEALRTTTRLMHGLAWLLNRRAFFAGELSEGQLRRHGRLPPAGPPSDPAQTALLRPELVDLIDCTRRFYARLERLEHAWREQPPAAPAMVHWMRDQLGRAVGGL